MNLRPSRIVRLKKGELFGSSRKPGTIVPPVFECAGKIKGSEVYRTAVRNLKYTWGGRYGLHRTFLSFNREKIKVFADIGAANLAGAPTTVDAKITLSPGAKVFAVDRKLSPKDLSKAGIEQLKHRITQAPLPFQCDAIRLANVVQYMGEKDLLRTLDNIWHSLKPKGFLLTAGPMEPTDRHKSVSGHNERVLVKVRKTKNNPYGFVELKLLDSQGRYLP